MSPSSTPRILIINPNTTANMTDALHQPVKSLGLQLESTFFTCPSPGIPSINSPRDAAASMEYTLPHLVPLLADHDAFLVACYSAHPLIPRLQSDLTTLPGPRRYVTGIFEASVLASLSIIAEDQTFGIVSTGKVWESALTDAVNDFLGGRSSRYIGTETTGLNATELHDLPVSDVNIKMKEATTRLLQKGQGRVGAICLGCAGMVGLEVAVREACVEALGKRDGSRIAIIDGVKAGIAQLVGNFSIHA